jgi:APA family basic amino acid/polyamine antiporter
VAACYLLLNYTFLITAPVAAMTGKVEVGFIAAQSAFGTTGARAMGVVLALLLTSTVSAMIVAGPRVLHAIGKDFPLFGRLAVVNADGLPTLAILAQAAITLLFLWTSSFEVILIFSGATMALNTFFAVLGVFVLRWRHPEIDRPYEIWLYPLPPLLFLAVTGWTLLYTIAQRPVEALMCAGVLVTGAILYFASITLGRRKPEPGEGQ